MSVRMLPVDTTSELLSKHLFRDDVVVRASQPELLGLVLSFSGDPGSDSEDNSDDEQDSGHGEEAEILWLNADEPVCTNVAELRVVDRPFTHGEVVVWRSYPLGQMGKVVDINLLVDLEMADGTITKGVGSKMLQRVRSFATGDIVVKDSWVGRIVDLYENVTVVFEDGTKCKVVDADPKTLVPNTPIFHEDEEFPYYPGQKVRAQSAKIFKKVRWSWKTKSLSATVAEVETSVVVVKWLQNRDGSSNLGKRVPEQEQSPKGLTGLVPFAYAEWNLGDRCILGMTVGRIVNSTTKVDVLWQNGDMSCETDSCELLHAEPSGENEFWPRQYVTERGAGADDDGQDMECGARVGVVKRIDSKQRTAEVVWIESGVPGEEELVGVYDLAEHVECDWGDLVYRFSPKSGARPNLDRQPWVGCIRGFTIEGDIEVIWHDGSISTVKPHEVKIEAYDDDSDSSFSGSDSDNDSMSEEDEVSQSGGLSEDVKMIDAPEAEEMEQPKNHATVSNEDESCEVFKQFDMVKDAADHHYLDSETGNSGNHRVWARRVQQEWTLLERNLPETIYVRVYEDRMDLLTAVLVGPEDTPYQDGLYVFDICLPPEYPHVPPKVHYRSGGLRLNPNLYEDGKVCLSLLNTWHGTQSEMWNPKASNILQVLLSIQGLVLIQNPFFNEPDFEKQKGTSEGQHNCGIYNESCFLLCCKNMLYILRRPPRHFETFVNHHFKKVAPKICKACKAYTAGAQVGCLQQDLSSTSTECTETSPALSSIGFRLALRKLVSKLEGAFSALK